MISFKTIAAICLGATLCFAQTIDISGVVKDSASGDPIVGAAVSLVIAGLKDTTDAEGKFHLKSQTTSILGSVAPVFSTVPVVSGQGIVTFGITGREQVTIHTFTAQGKLVHTFTKVVEAGKHTLALPRPAAGMLLHRITVGGITYTHNSVNIGIGQSFTAGSTQKGDASGLSTLSKRANSEFSDTIVVMFNEIVISRKAIAQPIIADYELKPTVFYGVTYNGNSNTGGTVPATQTKTQGVALTLATNSGSLVKTGYTFAGWNTAANGSGTSYAAGASYTTDAAIGLYAKWTTSGSGIVAGPTVTDADGNVYTSIVIGTQTWTVENLKTTKYNDGTSIPGPTFTNTQWSGLTTGAYCYYENNATNNAKYGALYNWYAVNTGKLAPEGWRVPTDREWDTLQNYLIANGYNWDGTTSGNKIAKSMAAQTDWASISTAGTIGNDLGKNNASGFSALPGGYRSFGGNFYYQSDVGYWWSATENYASLAYNRYLGYSSEDLYRYYDFKSGGFSVRLLRD